MNAVGHAAWHAMGVILTCAIFSVPTAQAAPGDLTLISVSSSGTVGNNHSDLGAISADGRYVAFRSRASNLESGSSGRRGDVYLHDRQTQTTTWVTRGSCLPSIVRGDFGNLDISADGRYVAFDSEFCDLVPDDNDERPDVFVYDRQTESIELISLFPSGAFGSGSATNPHISADGRYIAFTALINTYAYGYVYDRETGDLASIDSERGGYPCSISTDGRYIVASGWDGVTANALYLYDRDQQTSIRIDVTNTGEPISGTAGCGVISRNNQFVAFDVRTTDHRFDTFLRDLQTGMTELVTSEPSSGGALPFISGDGRYVGYTSEAVYVNDRQQALTERLTAADYNAVGSGISADGKYVVFTLYETSMLPQDTNSSADVYVYELAVSSPTSAIDFAPTTTSSYPVADNSPFRNSIWTGIAQSFTAIASRVKFAYYIYNAIAYGHSETYVIRLYPGDGVAGSPLAERTVLVDGVGSQVEGLLEVDLSSIALAVGDKYTVEITTAFPALESQAGIQVRANTAGGYDGGRFYHVGASYDESLFAGYDLNFRVTPVIMTPPPSSYSITPTAQFAEECDCDIEFTVHRTVYTAAETVYVSTVQDLGFTNSGDYVGKLNEPVYFSAGQTDAAVAIRIRDDATSESNESFRLIVQRVVGPVSESDASATFTIHDNDTAADVPILTAAPASLDFGAVQVGQVASRSITIQNTGTGTLRGICFAEAPYLVSSCSYELLAGDVQNVNASFAPTSAGSYSSSILFSSNAPDVSLGVTGIGSSDGPPPPPTPAISASPGTLLFPPTQINASSLPQILLVTNPGTANLTIERVQLGGLNSADFLVTHDGCTNAVIAPTADASCSVAMSFGPGWLGERSAVLEISSNAANSVLSIAMAGTGTSAAGSISPSISAIVPAEGSGGEIVRIQGRGFGPTQGSGYVMFGETRASSIVDWKDNTVQVRAPNGLVGPVVVKVVTIVGSSNLDKSFRYPARLVDVDPEVPVIKARQDFGLFSWSPDSTQPRRTVIEVTSRELGNLIAAPQYDTCYAGALDATSRAARRNYIHEGWQQLVTGIAGASVTLVSPVTAGYPFANLLLQTAAYLGADVWLDGRIDTEEALKELANNVGGYLFARATAEYLDGVGSFLTDLSRGSISDLLDEEDLLLWQYSESNSGSDALQLGQVPLTSVSVRAWYSPWTHYNTLVIDANCSGSSGSSERAIYTLKYEIAEEFSAATPIWETIRSSRIVSTW